MNEEDAYLELQDEIREYKTTLLRIQEIIAKADINLYHLKSYEKAISDIRAELRYLSL
jgi:hypothetical protein